VKLETDLAKTSGRGPLHPQRARPDAARADTATSIVTATAGGVSATRSGRQAAGPAAWALREVPRGG
jgi:hypothetical protein